MTGARAVAGVIGWPIGHSRSPLIHRHWLDRYGIDGDYTAIAVAPDDLPAFFAELRAGGYVGANVTVPHKTAALALADAADDAAQAIGAANTLVVCGGRVEARNTDAYGFLASLDSAAPGWRRPGPALVIGAGGAARAVVWALLGADMRPVRIVNRTRRRAEALSALFGANVEVADWDRRAAALEGAGIVVNTTTLGMTGHPPLDLDLGAAAPGAVVNDIVYAPLVTPLLAAARDRGLTAVDGLGMLLHQAVPGFAAWFGRTPDVTDDLRRLVSEDLEARK